MFAKVFISSSLGLVILICLIHAVLWLAAHCFKVVVQSVFLFQFVFLKQPSDDDKVVRNKLTYGSYIFAIAWKESCPSSPSFWHADWG